MKIRQDVLEVLQAGTIIENKFYLPNRQLDRKLYTDTNKVLSTLGGKWNRSSKAHVFGKDIEDVLDEVILSGEYTDEKKEFQFFETPVELAEKLVMLAGIIPTDRAVLEPSAGRGRIARVMPFCDCIELNVDNRVYLTSEGFNVVGDDFMSFEDTGYDVIIANPPFTRQQDIDHITHMIKLARRKVVSIASASVMFRDNKKTVEFRELVKSLGGSITALPEGSFKSSGTNVNTCIVEIDIV